MKLKKTDLPLFINGFSVGCLVWLEPNNIALKLLLLITCCLTFVWYGNLKYQEGKNQ